MKQTRGERWTRTWPRRAASFLALAMLALACPVLGHAQDSQAQAGDTSADAAPQTSAWHLQATSVTQGHPAFSAAFSGPNSLSSSATGRTSHDITLYGGFRPWAGAEVWINPELDQGFGMNNTLGVAAFPSGEAYKVGANTPYAKLPRLFLRQTIDLGGASQEVDPDLNVLGGRRTADRLVLWLGKFSVTDVFDTNSLAHDPRSDFLNWALIDTATFDYAANAWGYTYGAASEWYQGPWTLRAGLFDMSQAPNSPTLDDSFGQFQIDAEIERRFTLGGHDGAVRITGFLTRARMGQLADALRLGAETGEAPDTALVRRYASRGGVSLNAEQQLSDDLGLFLRAGLGDGHEEIYEFTDVDQTLAGGLSLAGKAWSRPDDKVGLAGVVNQISPLRQAYLAAGGLGILIGDGRLPKEAPETLVETYYDWAAVKGVNLTLDYQFITDPAYDPERGPVSVFAVRVHAQY